MKNKVKQINSQIFLILIDGPMGTGKTTTSKLLNEKLEGTARVGLDDIKRFVSGHKKNNKLGWDMSMIITEAYLKRRISVIVESAMKKEHVEAFVKIAKKNHVRHLVYQLSAQKNLLLARVKERTRILRKKSKLTIKNIKNIEEHFEDHYVFHTKNKYSNVNIIHSDKLNANQIVGLILKDIKHY